MSSKVAQLDCNNFGPLCHLYGHCTERLDCDNLFQGGGSCVKLTLEKNFLKVCRGTGAAAIQSEVFFFFFKVDVAQFYCLKNFSKKPTIRILLSK